MKPAFDPHDVKHAGVYAKDAFFCFESCAGYRSVVRERINAFLPGGASDAEVGQAVLEALSQYRALRESEIAEFRDLARVEAKHKEWELQLMFHAGYKTRQEIYRGLKYAPLRLVGSELSVSSTVKDRRHGFEGNGFRSVVDVALGPAAIGAAVKMAICECA